MPILLRLDNRTPVEASEQFSQGRILLRSKYKRSLFIAKQNKKIAQVVVGLPVEGPFDYSLPKEVQEKAFIGGRIKVSFNHRNRQGVIVGFTNKSKFKKLKVVQSLLDSRPLLDSSMLSLAKEISQYYGCSWGEAIEAVLPGLLRKGKFFSSFPNASVGNLDEVETDFKPVSVRPPTTNGSPRHEGTKAFGGDSSKTNFKKKSDVTLLHDLSRSDCWPFLIGKIQETLKCGQGIIFLVPEHSMIEGVLLKLKNLSFPNALVGNPDEARFGPPTKTFGGDRISSNLPIAVFDKKTTPKKELKQWLAVQTGNVSVAIGSRSTIFAPVKNLGLIIVYDEENSAYKQEQSPFYHVRDVVLMRSCVEKSSVIFVSSSPSLELWQQVLKKKIRLISFPAQKLGQVIPVDLTNFNARKTSLISFPLRNHIEKTLIQSGKVVLLMNRRGFSLLTRCYSCGHTFKCVRCDVNLSYSYAKKKMICRHCHAAVAVPSVCPKCQNTHLRSVGTGIEKLESELARIFPHAQLSTYDKDTQEIPQGFDILVATQAVLRIQDEVPAQLIGCIHIDSELNRHDLRAAEHTFALLVRLRLWAREKLVVQTRLLDNECLQAALKMDFKNFYKKELSIRRELGFPPFQHLVALNLRSVKEETVLQQAYDFYTELEKILPREIDMLEPQPDMVPKLRDKYRFMIMLKGKSVKQILTFIKNGLKQFKRKSTVTLTINVDP